jgi:hypothetical protein
LAGGAAFLGIFHAGGAICQFLGLLSLIGALFARLRAGR